MSWYRRLMVAFGIVAIGFAFLPYMSFPAERFSWERFAQAYEPSLSINHTSGQPGSFFVVTGTNFPASSSGSVIVNTRNLGTVETDAAGGVTFGISTTVDTDVGKYYVSLSIDPEPRTMFELDTDAPLRAGQDVDPAFNLPDGIGFDWSNYFPFVAR